MPDYKSKMHTIHDIAHAEQSNKRKVIEEKSNCSTALPLALTTTSALWLADSHPVSAATRDDWVQPQFTQPFTATYSLHGPHLLPVQEVCPKGLAQLLH